MIFCVCKESFPNQIFIEGRLCSVCGSRHTSFWTVSLHIPPHCQHVYPVSWGMLAVVLTCVSNGRDVSSEGQPNEGNGHYQNRGLLVAPQGIRAGGVGSYSPMLDPCSGSFGDCQQYANCFSAEVDLMGWTDGGHVICRGVWAVTDKALHPLVCSVNTEQHLCKTIQKQIWTQACNFRLICAFIWFEIISIYPSLVAYWQTLFDACS